MTSAPRHPTEATRNTLTPSDAGELDLRAPPPLPPFPWRLHNHFTLLPDGDRFYPRMLASVTQARDAIELEMYLFESGDVADQFIAALCEAAQRGVHVRVILDAVGSMFLRRPDRDRLRGAGVALRFYNRLSTHKWLRNLSRDHRKILVVDGIRAFVGGAGITDDFDPTVKGVGAWRELMLEISGPVVADWQALFELTWQRYRGPADNIHWRSRFPVLQSPRRSKRLHTDQPQARVNRSRGWGSEDIKGALIAELSKARYYAWISTAYFHPPWRLRRALVKAARRGVDVRLLLPGPHTDHPAIRFAGQHYYSELLKAGIQIFEYQPSFLHMKAAAIDDWCSIGSCNFDRWNLRWNLEANQETLDHRLSDALRSMMVEDFGRSRRIELNTWQHRPWTTRVVQRSLHRISMWVDRWINR